MEVFTVSLTGQDRTGQNLLWTKYLDVESPEPSLPTLTIGMGLSVAQILLVRDLILLQHMASLRTIDVVSSRTVVIGGGESQTGGD